MDMHPRQTGFIDRLYAFANVGSLIVIALSAIGLLVGFMTLSSPILTNETANALLLLGGICAGGIGGRAGTSPSIMTTQAPQWIRVWGTVLGSLLGAVMGHAIAPLLVP